MAILVRAVESEEEVEEQYLPNFHSDSEFNLQHLSEKQKHQLLECIPDQLFMGTPGRKDLVIHAIILKDPKPVRQSVYHVPEILLSVMKQELQTVARGAWFSEVCSGRKTQETAVSKWVKCKMRNTCV